MLLALSFALMFGFYISFGNLISSIFTPFGLSPQDISMVGLYLLLSGCIGAVVMGAWVDRTGAYKKTSLCLCAANIIFLTTVNQTVYHLEYSYTLFVSSCILMGFSSVSYIPLSLGFAAELTFPLQPALVNGGMLLAGQFSAFLQSLLFAFSLDVKTTEKDGNPVPADELLIRQ